MSLDQLYSSRPITKQSNYRSPIKGLYLCGSGAHPGMYTSKPITKHSNVRFLVK